MSDSDELPVVVPPSMDVLAADAATPRVPSAAPVSTSAANAATGAGERAAGTVAAPAQKTAATAAKAETTGAASAPKPEAKRGKQRAAKPAKGKSGPNKAGKSGRPVKKAAARRTAPAGGSRPRKAAAPGAAGATTGGTSAGAAAGTAAATGAVAAAASEQPKTGSRRPPQPAWIVRLFAPPNIDGPRARFGILWVLFAVPAVYFGAPWVAALYGLHAAIAALQTGQVWRREGYKASRLVAAPAAVAMPVLAIFSYQAPGVVVLVLPVLAMIAALAIPRRHRKLSAAAVAGATLRSAVPPGVAAMGMVFVARLGPQTGLVFLLLITAYDLGWFVFGAETRSGVPGVLMGAVTSLACTGALVALSVFLFKIPPFDGSNEEWVFGALVAVFAPLGQLVASLALPRASSWVPALRRLDSYILAAPVWAWVLWTAGV